MMLFINGEKTTGNFKNLFDVCAFFSDNPDVVATAVNGDFIPKYLREQTLLSAGDHIDIIAPLEGG